MTSALARLSLVTSGGRDAHAVGPVFVDERDLHRLGLDAEPGLGVLRQEAGEGLAVLVGMDLPAEHVFQVLVLEDGGGDRGGDPEDLLLRLHPGGERHRVRAGIDAVDDVDLLLVDQALDFIDRGVRLALRVGIDRRDLVFAADTAALVAKIDRNLRADRAGDRAAGRERPGVIEDDADAHRFRLRLGVAPVEAESGGGSGGIFQKRPARCLHRIPPQEYRHGGAGVSVMATRRCFSARLYGPFFALLSGSVFGERTAMSTQRFVRAFRL